MIAAESNGSYAVRNDGTIVRWGSTYVSSTASNVVSIPTSASGRGVALLRNGTVVGDTACGSSGFPAWLRDVVAVTTGDSFGVALKSDGAIFVCGTNNSVTSTPIGLTDVESIAAGSNHVLALKRNGTVVAWGSNSDGQINVPAGLSGVVAIAAGATHSLALKSDGTVVAWGTNWIGISTVPSGLSNVVAISAGGYFSVALKSNGTVVAWGYNDSGQVNIPIEATDVVAVAAGYSHVVALRSDGKTLVWGAGNNGHSKLKFPSTLGEDAQAPTVPINLMSTNVGSSGFTVSWSPALDNFAVLGYEVYINNVLTATSAVTNYNFNGLLSYTDYSISIKSPL